MDSTEIKVDLLHEIDCIEVTSGNGVKIKYPYVWLRDNCECSQCRHHNFKNQRKLTVLDLDLDTKVEECQFDRNLDCLLLTFSDGHQVSYQLDWLEKNNFSQENTKRVKRHGRLVPISWGREYRNHIYQENYDKVLTDDEVLLELISTVEVRGIAVLTGAPTEHGVLDKLNLRLGNISSTFFTPGPACMKFFLDKDAEYDHVAYSTEALELHTDIASASSHPVVQCLHAICQPEGVVNQVVDGKMIVDILRQRYPEALRLLSTVHVEYVANYTGFYNVRAVSGVPIITLDAEGDFVSMNVANEARAPGLSCKAEDGKAFYKALKTFMQVAKENTIDMVVPEGCILVLDNDRVMHGRAKFDLKTSCHRHLDVSYTDIDAMMSTKRLIQEKIQRQA